MEVAHATEAWSPRLRREHRGGGGRFRAEMEMDRGASVLPRGPEFGFAAAVREPLVRLQRPRFEFERWNWDYFAWPHDRLDANLEMRDSDPNATLEADRKASESFISRSTLELERCAIQWHTEEQHKDHGNEEAGLLKPLPADDEPTKFSSHVQASGCCPHFTVSVEHDGINGANLITSDSYPEAAVEADRDRLVSDGLLSRSTPQPEKCETELHTKMQEEEKEELELRASLLVADEPLHVHRKRRSEAPGTHGATRRRRRCAEANRILDLGTAMQGSWAC
ncbi:hypothetical protein ACP4OV_002987 [Aristida adscensionis]